MPPENSSVDSFLTVGSFFHFFPSGDDGGGGGGEGCFLCIVVVLLDINLCYGKKTLFKNQ